MYRAGQQTFERTHLATAVETRLATPRDNFSAQAAACSLPADIYMRADSLVNQSVYSLPPTHRAGYIILSPSPTAPIICRPQFCKQGALTSLGTQALNFRWVLQVTAVLPIPSKSPKRLGVCVVSASEDRAPSPPTARGRLRVAKVCSNCLTSLLKPQ